jgi:hypothetical protein
MKWWQIRKRNADLVRELQSDLELEEEAQRADSLSPEEVRYAARRALGNTVLIREHTHEAWGSASFERLMVKGALFSRIFFPITFGSSANLDRQ